MTDDGRTLRLKVGDAKLDDVGEARARISRHLMEALDLADGELLRVHGSQSILVRVVASTPDDEGLDILRLASAERRKAGVEIGDVVEAERHDIPTATTVRLVIVGHSGSYEPVAEDLRSELSAQPLMVGDTVPIAPKRTQFDAQVNVLGLTVAGIVGSSTECGALLARVVETDPSGFVQVSEETEIELERGSTDPIDSPADQRE
jgi:antitoxin component of MazEF toxin-antitoxin module